MLHKKRVLIIKLENLDTSGTLISTHNIPGDTPGGLVYYYVTIIKKNIHNRSGGKPVYSFSGFRSTLHCS